MWKTSDKNKKGWRQMSADYAWESRMRLALSFYSYMYSYPVKVVK